MTYWMLNAVFLAIVLIVVIAAIATKRSPKWRAVGFSAIILVIMTAIFDNIMIGVGLIAYDPQRFSGVLIGVAPLEDFAYTIAAVLLLPSLWMLLERRSRG